MTAVIDFLKYVNSFNKLSEFQWFGAFCRAPVLRHNRAKKMKFWDVHELRINELRRMVTWYRLPLSPLRNPVSLWFTGFFSFRYRKRFCWRFRYYFYDYFKGWEPDFSWDPPFRSVCFHCYFNSLSHREHLSRYRSQDLLTMLRHNRNLFPESVLSFPLVRLWYLMRNLVLCQYLL